MKGLALRRHHSQRTKNNVRYYFHYTILDPMHPKTIGRTARTKHPCSRYCCGNPRRDGELTMQERRANQEVYDGTRTEREGLATWK